MIKVNVRVRVRLKFRFWVSNTVRVSSRINVRFRF